MSQNGLRRGQRATLKLPDEVRKSIKAGALHPHLLIYNNREVTIRTLEKGKCKIYECPAVWIDQRWLDGYSNYYDYLEWATRPDEKEFIDPRRPRKVELEKPIIENINGVVRDELYRDLEIDDFVTVEISNLTRALIRQGKLSKEMLFFDHTKRRVVEIGKNEIKLFGSRLWFHERDFAEYNSYIDYLQRKESKMFKIETGFKLPGTKKTYTAITPRYPFDDLAEPVIGKDGEPEYSTFLVDKKLKKAAIAAVKKYMKGGPSPYKKVFNWFPEGEGCRIFRLDDRKDGEVIIIRTGFRGKTKKQFKIGHGFID